MNKFLILALLSSLALAGCKDEEDEASSFNITCDDNGAYTVSYPTQETATLTMGDQTYELNQSRSGSGTLYENDKIRFEEHQDTVSITYLDNPDAPISCTFVE